MNPDSNNPYFEEDKLSYRRYWPLIMGFLIFACFQLLIPYILNSFGLFTPSTTTCLCDKDTHLPDSSYAVVAITFTAVLFIVQAFVIWFSLHTVYIASFEGQTPVIAGTSVCTFKTAILTILQRFRTDTELRVHRCTTLVVLIIVIPVEIITYMCMTDAPSMYQLIFKMIEDCNLLNLDEIKTFKIFVDVTSILSTTLLLSAMCFFQQHITLGETRDNVNQLVYKTRLLNRCLFVAATYLVIGSMFLTTNLLWLAAYFPQNNPIHSIVRGIAFYQSTFYLLILFAIAAPIVVRLRYAAQILASIESSSVLKQQKWIHENGLSFSPYISVVQSLIGLLSLLVPVFSSLLSQ